MSKASYRINQNIKAKKIRLIDQEGKQLGIMETSKALKLAKEKSLDLAEVAPAAKPPVAKLLDFRKFLLEKKTKEGTTRKSYRAALKEIRIKPNIGEADLTTRAKLIKGFLRKGDRVKVTVFYRGREVTHPEVGLEKINKLIEMLQEAARVEEGPIKKKRTVEAILSSRKGG